MAPAVALHVRISSARTDYFDCGVSHGPEEEGEGLMLPMGQKPTSVAAEIHSSGKKIDIKK
jgi:hypothetical protein